MQIPSLAEIGTERIRREAEILQADLLTYVEQAWNVLEPGTPFQNNWHIGLLTEYLMAVTEGQITRLLVNMPPRCMKSLLMCVFWPTFVWINKPSTRWLTSSYSETLAIRDALKSRRLIQSEWYQKRFGHIYQLAGDQNVKSRYENNLFGHRIATGVGGMATGEGGDFLIADDLLKVQDTYSDLMRENANDFWLKTMPTRLNNPKTGVKVLIMQRLHEHDVTGAVLEAMQNETGEQYEHVVIPMEFVPKRFVSSIGLDDPRTEVGELLWDQRFPREFVENLKSTLGAMEYAGQFQQEPYPSAGGTFERSWFKIAKEYPPIDKVVARVRYWDKAATAGGGAYTAGVLMLFTSDYEVYVEDVVRGQWGTKQRDEIIRQVAEQDAAEDLTRFKNVIQTIIWHEQEPGSAGVDAAEAMARLLFGFSVMADRPTGKKEVRAGPWASQLAAGHVYLLEGSWNEAFIAEHVAFPVGKYKDQVDAASGAFSRLYDSVGSGIYV